jgi:hypothetical protein
MSHQPQVWSTTRDLFHWPVVSCHLQKRKRKRDKKQKKKEKKTNKKRKKRRKKRKKN